MYWQYLVVGSIIALALAYIVARAAQTWRGHCSSSCGCKSDDDKTVGDISTESLTLLKR